MRFIDRFTKEIRVIVVFLKLVNVEHMILNIFNLFLKINIKDKAAIKYNKTLYIHSDSKKFIKYYCYFLR